MDSELKRRMDELNELMKAGYVTEEEYATARENLLLDAGFDTIPREAGARPAPQSKRQERRRGCGCGCFIVAVLLLLVLLGTGFYALTALSGDGGYQVIANFFNDLRGKPIPAPDPLPEGSQGTLAEISQDEALPSPSFEGEGISPSDSFQ